MRPPGSVVVVANPTAGHGKAGRLIGKVDRLLHEHGISHEILVSESGPGLQRLVREAAEGGSEIVAALGGDGTMGLAANGLLGTDSALAPLPSGTADDFAHALGIRNLEAGVRALAAGTAARIDVVRVRTDGQERHYVNIAGCGFDSEVTEAANAMRIRLGSTGTYVAALLKTLSRFSPADFRIQIDDETIEGPHMLVVVGNGISYGGGMHVTPAASVVDGMLDVCLLQALPVSAFLRAFPKVFRGTHVTHPKVRMHRARRIAVEADRRVMVYADGERVGPGPVEFDVVPAALPVIVGPNAKAVR
jgi:diacylglycerol kinase (ATP)